MTGPLKRTSGPRPPKSGAPPAAPTPPDRFTTQYPFAATPEPDDPVPPEPDDPVPSEPWCGELGAREWFDFACLSWAELLARECGALTGGLWPDLGALGYGDWADGKLEADAATAGTASAGKPAAKVTVKMARCRVWATVMAVSPLVVAQARAMPGASAHGIGY